MPWKSKEKRKEYYRKWYAKNGRNRAIDYTEAIYEWEKKNPEKKKAHRIVRGALTKGLIVKPKNCTTCARETRISAHHKDYTKPLEVIWLCGSCHKKLHNSP